MNTTLEAVVSELRQRAGVEIIRPSARAVRGGCINESHILTDAESGKTWFVKTNAPDRLEAFRAEFEGLDELRRSQTIRVPAPLLAGEVAGAAYLVMEALRLGPPRDRHAAEVRLGQQLAALHQVEAERFGWHRNNRIGDTPQINLWQDDWISFFGEHRLGYQWRLAQTKGLDLPEMEPLLAALPTFFVGYKPRPSLLHGDLWSGNVSYDEHDQPVLFDPAVYFGDRETDLAFTEMFGGFGDTFYQAYDVESPRDTGHRRRVELYNLYHLLNHFNLFGGSYGHSARSVTARLVRSL